MPATSVPCVGGVPLRIGIRRDVFEMHPWGCSRSDAPTSALRFVSPTPRTCRSACARSGFSLGVLSEVYGYRSRSTQPAKRSPVYGRFPVVPRSVTHEWYSVYIRSRLVLRRLDLRRRRIFQKGWISMWSEIPIAFGVSPVGNITIGILRFTNRSISCKYHLPGASTETHKQARGRAFIKRLAIRSMIRACA